MAYNTLPLNVSPDGSIAYITGPNPFSWGPPTVGGFTIIDPSLPGYGTFYAYMPEGAPRGGGGGGDSGPPPVYKTTTVTQQSNIMGYYNNIDNTYGINGNYITDISISPFIRSQQISVRAQNLLFNTEVHNYFDGVNVDRYMKKPNILELSNVSGTFLENDIIGYLVSGNFYPTALVIGQYAYPSDNTKIRLYVTGDNSNTYTTNGIISNAYLNANGNFQISTGFGALLNIQHNSGKVGNNSIKVAGSLWPRNVGGYTPANVISGIQLSNTASSINNYYVGNTIYMVTGVDMGQSSTIVSYDGNTKIANISSYFAANVGDVYSIGTFSTNEVGDYFGTFHLPQSKFYCGEKTFSVDNRINDILGTETCWAKSIFYGQGLATRSQQLNFGASPSGAKNTFTQTATRTVVTVGGKVTSNTTVLTESNKTCELDPVAQTFIIDSVNYPNGAFLSGIKLFFSSKPTSYNSPITLSVVNTLNGYPNGTTLDHGVVTKQSTEINVSTTPHYLDPNTYTVFQFNSPLYIQPDTLYAFIVKSQSNEYKLYSSSLGDTAIASTVKNNPTDANPSIIPKINSVPYVGSLFVSQNAQTWVADQNESLMFVIDRCVFDTTKTPRIRFVVPKKLPLRPILEEKLEIISGNDFTSSIPTYSGQMNIDAFNVTSTDFIPTGSSINYTYNATLSNGSAAGEMSINPGKSGASSYENIWLDDGKGERILDANTDTSFSVYATLSSNDNAISPILSDAGLSLHALQFSINNCEFLNSMISIANTGSSYNANTTIVTISSPTGVNGTQAYATANIANGSFQGLNITSTGSGYIETPTITITDPMGGHGANLVVTGETSAIGGNAFAKYITKPVSLDAGFDSGDLNVYLTAYRPVGTDIHVYYKILNSLDTQTFQDGNWQLMTKIKNSSSLYSQKRDELYEYVFAPGTGGVQQGFVNYTSKTTGQVYNTFNQFALKIIMITSDKTIVPYVNDLRSIALPADTKTTFTSS